ncbi:hypothetical protein F511_47604, partial [Dorcoceras hygrometricum]
HEVWVQCNNMLSHGCSKDFSIKRLLAELRQGSTEINSYYTRMRTLWDELKDFQPISVCRCGSMREWMDYRDQECAIKFLMGLNDFYAQIILE